MSAREGRGEAPSSFDLEGRVALVTGGRRGLGLAMARGLSRAGARIAVADVTSLSEEFERQLREEGTPIEYIQADLSMREEQLGVVPRLLERMGRLDILVNCAGIQHRQASLEFDLDRWDQILAVMLTAPFVLSQGAARAMLEQGGGKIINIASLASFQGAWTVPAYTAAKHGIVGITKALANEWAAKNINVNAIAPGYFATEMCEGILKDPEREPQIRARIPAGRWGTPDDLIGAVLYLSSDASRYVHGQVLVVDGGWLAR